MGRRLIDAEALRREIDCCDFDSQVDKLIICQQINEAPTVNAVPVVFCKECKWNRPDILLDKYWCTHFCIGMEVRGDDFCSYGERGGETHGNA